MLGDRRDYSGEEITITPDNPDPIALWHRWLADAIEAGSDEPTAAVVSTIDEEGCPDARYVLIRVVDTGGFVFYTNYNSAKSRQLAASPHASLVFGWLAQHRSVRVRGTVELVDALNADRYFAGRPRGSQLSAWASHQSAAIPDRTHLEQQMDSMQRRFAGTDVPRPAFWGGWRVIPRTIEFWQGQPDRLHDRIRYTQQASSWTTERLAP